VGPVDARVTNICFPSFVVTLPILDILSFQ
jgi:hypothetical protein